MDQFAPYVILPVQNAQVLLQIAHFAVWIIIWKIMLVILAQVDVQPAILQQFAQLVTLIMNFNLTYVWLAHYHNTSLMEIVMIASVHVQLVLDQLLTVTHAQQEHTLIKINV